MSLVPVNGQRGRPLRVPHRVQPARPRRSSPSITRASATHTTKEKLLRAVSKRQNGYEYKSITREQARILILHPTARGRGGLSVTLQEVSFQDLGDQEHMGQKWPYEALSYHWGTGQIDDERPIRVYDEFSTESMSTYPHLSDVVDAADSKQIWVRPNLYQALLHLRHEVDPIPLWVDALRINQDDVVEKENQVCNMAQIYARASNVLIWLGKGDDSSKRAMDFIGKIVDLSNLEAIVSDKSQINAWSDLLHLMRSAWFSRRWVIQELALARDATVHCGEKQVHWNDIRDAISLFDLNFDTIKKHFKPSPDHDNDYNAMGEDLGALGAKVLVDEINNIFRSGRAGAAPEPVQGLEFLVSKLSTFETSDPRDTIHALRNIAKESRISTTASDSRESPPEPDYTKNLLSVYVDFVKWVVATSGCIDIICRHWAIPEREKNEMFYPKRVQLPTWIQQTSDAPFGRQREALKGRLQGDSFVGLPGQGCYRAAHDTQASISFGEQIDSVNVASSPLSSAIGEAQDSVMGAQNNPLVVEQLKSMHMHAATHGVPGRRAGEEFPLEQHGPPTAQFTAEPSPTSERSAKHYLAASTSQGVAGVKPSFLPNSPPMSPPEPSVNGRSRVDTLDSVQSLFPDEITVSSTQRAVVQQFISERRDGALHVRGIHVADLTFVSDPIADGVLPEKVLRKLGAQIDRISGQYEQPVPDKVWRTLVAERGPDGRNPPTIYEKACPQSFAYQSTNRHINTKDLLQKTQAPPVRDFLKRVQAVTWNRRFLEASFGNASRREKLHGFGPHKAEVDDSICILFGCSVPVILRRQKVPGIGEYYTFRGEAYMYGIVDGQLIAPLSRTELERQARTFMIL